MWCNNVMMYPRSKEWKTWIIREGRGTEKRREERKVREREGKRGERNREEERRDQMRREELRKSKGKREGGAGEREGERERETLACSLALFYFKRISKLGNQKYPILESHT